MSTSMTASLAAAASCALVAAGGAQADGAPEPSADVPVDRAVIRFVDYGGIRDWRAEDDEAIYIEGANRKWYKATFFGSCLGLRSSLSVGFVSDPTGSLDRFGSIIVRSPGLGLRECHFRTLTEVPGPPGKAESEAERTAQ